MAINREVPRELPVGKANKFILRFRAGLSSLGTEGTLGEPRANPDCIPQDSGAELTYSV